MFQDDRGGFTLYVHGFDETDAEDPSGDWATEAPSWEPAARYVRLPSLSKMGSDEWETAHQRARDLLRALSPHGGHRRQFSVVGLGFDDGDFERVWP